MKFKHVWLITTLLLTLLAVVIRAEEEPSTVIVQHDDDQTIPHHQVTLDELESVDSEKFTFQVSYYTIIYFLI